MISCEKIEFTGIVVTYNDARHLRNCLKSLRFCEEIIVIDLGSKDASIEIAEECGAEIIHHEWVPIVEQIRKEAVECSKNDWIIYLDPDELFPSDTVPKLRSMIVQNPGLGAISAPWQFYFKGRPLKTSIWGMEKSKGIVHHKYKNRFVAEVHRGTYLRNGFFCITLPREPENLVKHYWMDSYKQLFEKHWRYIKHEGEARYFGGERFSWVTLAHSTISALKTNLIDYNGLRGGFVGIFLSFFYSWYLFMSLLSLLKYQYQMKNKTSV